MKMLHMSGYTRSLYPKDTVALIECIFTTVQEVHCIPTACAAERTRSVKNLQMPDSRPKNLS